MRLGFVLALIFTLGWVPLFFIRTEKLRDTFPLYGRGERVAVILAPAVLGMHVALACFLMSAMASISATRAALGLLIFVSGIGLWVWARSAIGPFRERLLPAEPPLRFHRDGPFGLVRNPLYLGLLVAASAPLVVTTRAVLLLTFALCVVVLAIRAAQEERWMRVHLGSAYEAYCREVKRLIPFVW